MFRSEENGCVQHRRFRRAVRLSPLSGTGKLFLKFKTDEAWPPTLGATPASSRTKVESGSTSPQFSPPRRFSERMKSRNSQAIFCLRWHGNSSLCTVLLTPRQIHDRTRNAQPRIQILALQVRPSPLQGLGTTMDQLHYSCHHTTLLTPQLYRSLFMWYMWRIVDVDTSAMQ
jgi:hypothetical protein